MAYESLLSEDGKKSRFVTIWRHKFRQEINKDGDNDRQHPGQFEKKGKRENKWEK